MLIAEWIQFITSAFLCGLIWVIQLLHYPAFAFVDEDKFVEFERFHTRSITFLVGPTMILELGSAIYLCHLNWQGSEMIFYLLNLIIIILIWLSTALLSVPCHQALSKGKDPAVVKRLVLTNWPRTILWSAKLFLLVYLLS